nr:hypothetical protein [Klebsiella pneumoniae]
MHGVINIWHWNSIANKYEWCIPVTSKNVS